MSFVLFATFYVLLGIGYRSGFSDEVAKSRKYKELNIFDEEQIFKQPPHLQGFRKLQSINVMSHLPTGLVNQTKEERNYLKLYKCADVFEAYSASYLITREHLMEQFTFYNLTWVNCEMGSFIMMNQRARAERNVNGSVTQTLDLFDFSVIHLSWFERLQNRHAKTVEWNRQYPKSRYTSKDAVKALNESEKSKMKFLMKEIKKLAPSSELFSISKIKEARDFLKTRALRLREIDAPLAIAELNRTVAIMPFLGGDMGAGHSKLGNRLVHITIYLNLIS